MNTEANASSIDVSELTAKQLDLVLQAFSRGCQHDGRIDFDLERSFLALLYETISAKLIAEIRQGKS